MTVTIDEKFESRRITTGANPSVELIYIGRGSNDDSAVMAAALAATPTSYNLLPRQDVSIEPTGELLWTITVKYAVSNIAPPPTGGSTFSFETGGGTQHITQSLATVGKFAPPGKTAPDHKGAIGVDGNTVNGVDIVVPTYHFSETHFLDDALVTNTYKGILLGLTGRVNDAPFKGTDTGECLLMGVSGSKRSDSDWEINFRFAASQNATNLAVGDIIVTQKNGWDYLWVSYEQVKDSASKSMVMNPTAAYVEQVYRIGDFSTLGIGV